MTISSKGKGKSHGARVIYHTIVSVNEGCIWLLSIYDKAERESISDNELKQLLKEIL